MKYATYTAVAAILMTLIALNANPAQAHIKDAIVFTQTLDGSSGCSGVIIDKRGFLITAKHCGGQARINVMLSNGRLVKADLVYVGPNDEDVLGYMLPTGTYPFAPVAALPPKQGEVVQSWGYPASNEHDYVRKLMYGKGTIIGGAIYANSRMNLVYLVTYGGWSGSGLFNMKGEVIGSLSAGNNTISLFISLRSIKVAYRVMDAYYKADQEFPYFPPLVPTSYESESAIIEENQLI
jgi:S1-C subfamily serine protease